MIYYGPKYTNEHLTTDPTKWIEAASIEDMQNTGLPLGYKPSASGKCWYKKGFLGLGTGERLVADPLPMIAGSNRKCFCGDSPSPPSGRRLGTSLIDGHSIMSASP